MKPYQVRLINEYRDLYLKRKNLGLFISNLKAGNIHYTVNTPVELFEEQYEVMSDYLSILKERADIEGVEF